MIAHLQETRSLFNLEDDDKETVFCRSDSLPSDDVKKPLHNLEDLVCLG